MPNLKGRLYPKKLAQSHKLPRFIRKYLSTQLIPPTQYRGPTAIKHIPQEDVTNQLAKLGKGRTGGKSGLTNDILFNSDKKVHKAIANLLNTCLEIGLQIWIAEF